MSEAASPVRDRVSAEEWAVRVDLAAAHRFAAIDGMVERAGIYNHFAARVPAEPSFMLIKPHRLMFHEVTASSLLKVDMKGPPGTFDDDINPAGFALHGAVLLGRPDVNATMHCHAMAGLVLASLKKGLLPLQQDGMRFYERIGYHDFEGYASLDEAGRIQRALGMHFALVLRNHGLLTCGPNMGCAMREMRVLIEAAQLQLNTLATGQEYILPAPDLCAEVAQLTRSMPDQPEVWEATKRYLDGIDRSYRN